MSKWNWRCPYVIKLATFQTMIRRNPTLIPLEDADIADVKEFLNRRKNAASEQGTKKKDNKNNGPLVAAEEGKRKREAQTRDERLGIR